MNMLDLQSMESQEIKIKWIDGELVSVNEPTFAMFKKLSNINQDDNEGIGKVLVEMLNNNTSAKKFKASDLDPLNSGQLTALIQKLMGQKEVADQDPN
ncbi:MAG: hypothetical protein L0J50_12460 [Lactococcus lactis]|nr:hypothetical protein [Lactococcus lactis]